MVNILERFFYRYKIVCDAHVGQLSILYYETAKKIRNPKEQFDMKAFTDSLNKLLKKDASDKIFSEKLKNINYSNTSRNQIKYFFTTIEQYYPWNKPTSRKLKPTKTHKFIFDSIDIDHIYPQTPVNKIAELNPLVDDIGNLTILGPEDNRDRNFGNKSFERKKTVYKSSTIHINKKIAAYHQWNKRNLEKRRKNLVTYALKVFSI